MTAVPHLFDQVTLGSVTLRNRVIQLPCTNNLGRDGRVTPAQIAFYRARARGGVGLIVTEGLRVHPNDASPRALPIFDPGVVTGLAQLAQEVKAEGAAIIGQLIHGGRQHHLDRPKTVVGPSEVRCPFSGYIPHALSLDEVAHMRDNFVLSARHAQQAGFDGVEVHASHGHLLQQFISPFSNHREDRYGGDLDGRLRLTREIVDGIRAACGDTFVLGVRLCADEFVDGGIDLDMAIAVAATLEATTSIDYLSVSQANFVTLAEHAPDRQFPPHPFVANAGRIRAALTRIPVVATGRIRTPAEAEQLLADGVADLIGLNRPLVVDPEWAAKAQRGAADEIRGCIYCNLCWQMISDGQDIGCVHNPLAGRELSLGPVERSLERKTVTVLGGGPAGLAAAEAAAERGHEVTLFEADAELGGQLSWARSVEGHEELANVVTYLVGRLERLGVSVKLRHRVTAAEIADGAPDTVVVATGSTADDDPFDHAVDILVRSAWDVLQDGALPEGTAHVLLLDADAYVTGFMTAESLCRQDCRVTYVTRHFQPGRDLPKVSLTRWLGRLHAAGTEFVSTSWLTRTQDSNAVLRHEFSGLERVIPDVDLVVVAGALKATDSIYHELGKHPTLDIRLVGDAYAPRTLKQAIDEGHLCGRSI